MLNKYTRDMLRLISMFCFHMPSCIVFICLSCDLNLEMDVTLVFMKSLREALYNFVSSMFFPFNVRTSLMYLANIQFENYPKTN